MFVLSESPAGVGLLKITDDAHFESVESVEELFKDTEKAKKVLDVVKFKQFESMEQAMEASLIGEDGHKKLIKPLKKILKKQFSGDSKNILLLENPKLGSIINKKFGVQCKADSVALEVIRNVRQHLNEFITGLDSKDSVVMNRGLAHHFSRFKLQFTAEKEDTMIIHAIKLLEDLDKWLNTLCMRLREWFGINFPELQKIVNDNLLFAKIVQRGKTRTGILEQDMSDFLEEEMEQEVKAAAKYSMGSRISSEDLARISGLAELVIDYTEDRSRLNAYLTTRMQTIAPNLAAVVGERVGAKLIAHASSLTNLAKCPASTLQIMGAEKALFRAMKSRSATPKYGHIYHAHLVGSSSAKLRGKVARSLACKASIASRIDAFDANNNDAEIGIQLRSKVEKRIDLLTHGKRGRYTKNNMAPEPVATVTKPKKYDPKTDVVVKEEKKTVELTIKEVKTEEPKKKKKKKKKRKAEEAEITEAPPKKKKKKNKEKKAVAEPVAETPAETPKKKKKKKKKKDKST